MLRRNWLRMYFSTVRWGGLKAVYTLSLRNHTKFVCIKYHTFVFRSCNNDTKFVKQSLVIPNRAEPVAAKRKSRFIGELKIEDCRLNICGGRSPRRRRYNPYEPEASLSPF
jgi:hypothetical protein